MVIRPCGLVVEYRGGRRDGGSYEIRGLGQTRWERIEMLDVDFGQRISPYGMIPLPTFSDLARGAVAPAAKILLM